jgi:hypothetical protein
MAMKEQQRAVYRSMQGKEVDMAKLVVQNEMTVAVGNVRVNARGDELGPGGKIIRKREEVLKDYYQETANATPDQVVNRNAPARAEEAPAEQTITSKLKPKD